MVPTPRDVRGPRGATGVVYVIADLHLCGADLRPYRAGEPETPATVHARVLAARLVAHARVLASPPILVLAGDVIDCPAEVLHDAQYTDKISDETAAVMGWILDRSSEPAPAPAALQVLRDAALDPGTGERRFIIQWITGNHDAGISPYVRARWTGTPVGPMPGSASTWYYGPDIRVMHGHQLDPLNCDVAGRSYASEAGQREMSPSYLMSPGYHMVRARLPANPRAPRSPPWLRTRDQGWLAVVLGATGLGRVLLWCALCFASNTLLFWLLYIPASTSPVIPETSAVAWARRARAYINIDGGWALHLARRFGSYWRVAGALLAHVDPYNWAHYIGPLLPRDRRIVIVGHTHLPASVEYIEDNLCVVHTGHWDAGEHDTKGGAWSAARVWVDADTEAVGAPEIVRMG